MGSWRYLFINEFTHFFGPSSGRANSRHSCSANKKHDYLDLAQPKTRVQLAQVSLLFLCNPLKPLGSTRQVQALVRRTICSKIAHGLNCLDERRRGSGRGGGGASPPTESTDCPGLASQLGPQHCKKHERARCAANVVSTPLCALAFLLTKSESRSNLFSWIKTNNRVWLGEVGCHSEKMAFVQPVTRAGQKKSFSIRIGRNLLKSQESEKLLKGNESKRPFVLFHFLAFSFAELTLRLYSSPWGWGRA